MRAVVFLWLVLFACPAQAVPDKTLITVNYHPDEIRYIHKNKNIKCSQNKRGNIILGCARDKKRLEMKVDCHNRLIQVDVFSTEREIEIHSDLKKETCEYQNVLDHEMTHMNLHVEALENVLNRGMNDILDAFNRMYKRGRGCQAATEAARKAFNKFSRRYEREDYHINQEFDRDDADSIVFNCKPEPKVQTFYDQADVKYVSVASPKCLNTHLGCFLENGYKKCGPIRVLACTDMPVRFKTEIKTYLGQVNITADASEITTKISSDFPVGSCEYEMLKNYELEKVDAMEEILYDFLDGLIPALEKVYSEKLKEEASSQELTDTVDFSFRENVAQLGKRFEAVERKFRPLTREELELSCKK